MGLGNILNNIRKAFKEKKDRNPHWIKYKGKLYSEPEYKKIIAKESKKPVTKTVSKPNIPQGVKAVTKKSDFHLLVEKSVGSYKSFTGYYNRIKSKKWKEYYNDIYTQVQELQRLKDNLPLNCTDHCQLGYAVAKDLDYQVRFIHIKCNSGGGHITLIIKGHEFKDWTKIDLAAAANSDYPIGKIWCSSGNVVSTDDPWLLTDDGR